VSEIQGEAVRRLAAATAVAPTDEIARQFARLTAWMQDTDEYVTEAVARALLSAAPDHGPAAPAGTGDRP
jgi:hypothetical protein